MQTQSEFCVINDYSIQTADSAFVPVRVVGLSLRLRVSHSVLATADVQSAPYDKQYGNDQMPCGQEKGARIVKRECVGGRSSQITVCTLMA